MWQFGCVGFNLHPSADCVMWTATVYARLHQTKHKCFVSTDFNENVLHWDGHGHDFFYKGTRYHLDDSTLFLWSSDLKKNVFDDDTFMMGTRLAMQRGIASLRPALDAGTKKVSDALYFESLKRNNCLLYTSPSPRDKRQSRMPSSA